MAMTSPAPLPAEYGFLDLSGLLREWPADVSERVLVAVDCANEERIADPEVLGRVPLVVNIDHHHDNSRFGQVNLIVADASSTGEVLRDVLRELDVALTPEIAEALYVALVTDTGRFQYTNTTPKAHGLATELLEAGADVHRVFQGVYESMEFAKLKLLGAGDRPRAGVRGWADRRLQPPAHGLRRGRRGRAVLGGDHRLAAGGRRRRAGGADPRAAALGRADAPRLAARLRRRARRVVDRARAGGGGHRQAAGFSSEASVEEITEFIRSAYREQRDGAAASS